MTTDSVIKYIHANQLASVMNKTKWRELADEMTSNPDFYPEVWIKYVWDESANPEYAHPDWELIKYGGDGRFIEWMDIDPIKRDRVGWLVDDLTTDFTPWLREALQKHSIPFSEDNGIFRIYGYLRPNGN